jgi:hypothetical protein
MDIQDFYDEIETDKEILKYYENYEKLSKS